MASSAARGAAAVGSNSNSNAGGDSGAGGTSVELVQLAPVGQQQPATETTARAGGPRKSRARSRKSRVAKLLTSRTRRSTASSSPTSTPATITESVPSQSHDRDGDSDDTHKGDQLRRQSTTSHLLRSALRCKAMPVLLDFLDDRVQVSKAGTKGRPP